MPEAPAATPVLSTTTTSSPALARCHAVERPWTPAPMTRCLTEAGREGGTEAPTHWCCLRRNRIAKASKEASAPHGWMRARHRAADAADDARAHQRAAQRGGVARDAAAPHDARSPIDGPTTTVSG